MSCVNLIDALNVASMHHDFSKEIENKSDEELLKIYVDADDYQPEFSELVELELTNCQVDLASYTLRKEHKTAFYTELYERGRPGNTIYIILGFISSLFGGFLGIVAGYVYSQAKHKDFGDGSIYVYDKKTRNIGTGMMALGVLAFIFEWVLIVTK